MGVSGIFGLQDIPLRIDWEGISLSVDGVAGGLLYKRKCMDEEVGDIIVSSNGKILINPVEPVNNPKEQTPHVLTKWYALKMEMLWEIKKTLGENGIEIAFPQRVVWFADELRKREVRDAESGSSGNSLYETP